MTRNNSNWNKFINEPRWEPRFDFGFKCHESKKKTTNFVYNYNVFLHKKHHKQKQKEHWCKSMTKFPNKLSRSHMKTQRLANKPGWNKINKDIRMNPQTTTISFLVINPLLTRVLLKEMSKENMVLLYKEKFRISYCPM